MSAPNFSRGVPPTPAPTKGSGDLPRSTTPKWLAKYDGTCEYCQASITEGEDRVQWNDDRTAVVCSHHKVTPPAPEWTL